MKGSNTYIAAAVDMYFKSINSEFRIARQSDLETNLKMFKGFYIDSGFALRNLEGRLIEDYKKSLFFSYQSRHGY